MRLLSLFSEAVVHNLPWGTTYRSHVMTLVIHLTILFFDVELAEKVEGYHSVDVHDHTRQHHCQHKLGTKWKSGKTT